MTAPPVAVGEDQLVERLHAATAHGDQEHRDWLLAAYTAFFAGKPVPAPRGSGRKEKLIRDQAAEIAGLKLRVGELEGAAQQAADALYPFISMIAHAFDEDGGYYWTCDPTDAESKAALDATRAVSTVLHQGEGR